ncbi:MAG: ATP-binding protein [Kiritimatiellae bacterium]|nr:ATP-binding protein [Kiritimatiellia bacterium]
MDDLEMQRLFDAMEHRAQSVKTGFHRYLCQSIDWRDHLICIKGAKGTGKTTLLLQHYVEEYRRKRQGGALYVSADDLWFSAHSLADVAQYMHSHGLVRLFVDEVHYLPDWQRTIKNVSDEYGGIDIAYSGSSLLKLERGKADLSRRQAVYELRGLSFREYLQFEGVAAFPAVSLEDVVGHHRDIALEVVSKTKILPLFAKYLKGGFYPFYKSVRNLYGARLTDVVNQVLEGDLPAIENVEPATIRKLKRMLVVLCESCPQLPKMGDLFGELETTRAQGLRMLDLLERAALVQQLKSEKATLKNLSRPDKIYPDNTNMMCALVGSADVGTLRETFFLNQLRGAGHDVKYPPRGDFLVDSRWLFEVGGAGKGFGQIRNIPDSHVVSDDIETGFGNKIPLWLFGLLY